MYSNPYYQQQRPLYQSPQFNNMGGYYNQMGGSTYYNPYLAQQQAKKLEAQRKEEERQQADIWKKLSKNSNKIHQYVDDIEEHVKKYDPTEISKEIEEEQHYNKLLNLYSTSFNNPICNRGDVIVQNINARIIKVKAEFPDDMDMGEYFSKAGELIVEAKIQQTRSRQRDISQLYKGADYSELIKYHASGNGYYNSVFRGNMNNRNVNIDDMEITLPSHIGGEYHEKRKKFLESIMN